MAKHGSSIARYKINTLKSVSCLYTKNKLSEREIREKISFIIASSKMKFLEINLTKETKDLSNEHSSTLKNKIEVGITK